MMHLFRKNDNKSANLSEHFKACAAKDRDTDSDLRCIIKNNPNSSSLTELISTKLWEAVLHKLESMDSAVPSTKRHNDQILHLACKNHPSPAVVLEIIKKFPGALTKTDRQNQYPMHCAAEYGACPEVIHILCERYPPALKHQDIDGRTPLILACKSYSANHRHTKGGPTLLKKHAVAQSIRLLARACPSASHLEDNLEYSCIEYALDSEIDLGTIRIIQKASYGEWMRRENEFIKSQ